MSNPGSAATGFIPLRLCVLTVSDTRTAADDGSGDYLVEALSAAAYRSGSPTTASTASW